MIDAERLPREIRESTRAVVWKWEQRNGKRTKPPYVASAPEEKASATDPLTWASFTEALDTYHDGKSDGVGIVLGDGLAGVDLDNCRNPESGEIAEWALAIIRRMNSYTEISPSGRGVKTFVRGTLPQGGRNRKGSIEIYDRDRYFTVTASHLAGTPTTIEERTAELAALHAEVFGKNGGRPETPPRRETSAPSLDDAELLERARSASNGAKFSALWSGDRDGYASHSEADQALCNLLAFWTSADAARIDGLFRQSGLYREKWDRDDYRERTIARALEDCRDTYFEPRRPKARVKVVDTEKPQTTKPQTYTFTSAMPEGHFLTDWVRYCATRTDAAHEIHEAGGLTLLASATPRIRLPLRSGRIGTNLYTLVVAESTTSRKTTSKDFAKDAHKAAFTEHTICPGLSSPEGFFEHLSEQPWSTFYSDELGELLRKMQSAKFMAGFGGHLLELYAGGDHVYRRSSKRTRDNKPVRDEIKVTDVHLSILGLTTPVTLEMLTRADIENGLLARFAIVMPDGKPERINYFAVEEPKGLNTFNTLVVMLAKLRLWTTNGAIRDVRFADGVFDCLEQIAIEIEDAARGASDTARIMLHRLTPMAGKIAACLAAGRPETLNEPTLTITLEDAEGAVTIMRRRTKDALTFAARVGENEFERHVASCARIVRERGSVPRRIVAQNCHVEKKVLDSIEATLLDRGHISVTDGGRIWSWNK